MKKKMISDKSIVRLCEGSYKLIKESAIKGEYYLENQEGFLALIVNSKGVKEKQCKSIKECEDFFK